MTHTQLNRTGFKMLSGGRAKALVKYEYTVIWLMVLVAATSIVWSISIDIISGDFSHEILGAKLVFRERDFTQLGDHAKDIFNHDLGLILNETYSDAALKASTSANSAEAIAEMQTMPAADAPNDESQISTTEKPKVHKIAHLFRLSSTDDMPNTFNPDDEPEETNTTTLPNVKFDAEKDRIFLTRMSIDVHQTRWGRSIGVQFVYNFPLLSEIIAIVWTAMCLIFQSGVTKYWGLPKPWRIVIPSILVFSLMSMGALIYTILANGYLTSLCADLRASLTDPNAISCGQAMSVLRPVIRPHEFQNTVYLNLFRGSYMLCLVLWVLALLVMVLRYVFAIDFQLTDAPLAQFSASPEVGRKYAPVEFRDVPLNTPVRNISHQLCIDERPRSDDDFQSAKSHLSEVATPLLDAKGQTLPA